MPSQAVQFHTDTDGINVSQAQAVQFHRDIQGPISWETDNGATCCTSTNPTPVDLLRRNQMSNDRYGAQVRQASALGDSGKLEPLDTGSDRESARDKTYLSQAVPSMTHGHSITVTWSLGLTLDHASCGSLRMTYSQHKSIPDSRPPHESHVTAKCQFFMAFKISRTHSMPENPCSRGPTTPAPRASPKTAPHGGPSASEHALGGAFSR